MLLFKAVGADSGEQPGETVPVASLRSAETRYRSLTELILPGTALELKLSREWNYKELYLAALEATAKLCRVSKYQIYTVEGLVEKIQEKLDRMPQEEREKLPAFTAFFETCEV